MHGHRVMAAGRAWSMTLGFSHRGAGSFLRRMVIAGVLLAGTAPLAAQADPRLQEALRLAQDGASDSARAMVGRLLAVTPPSDSAFPEMLYTMGLVSRSIEEMRRNYTRVAVEYTMSPWADDAIYRLALLDYAAGNAASALRQLEKLLADYPGSMLLGPGSEWAAKIHFSQRRQREGCEWLAIGLPRSGEDVELRNRLEFLNARCLAQPPADTTTRDTTPPPAPPTDTTRQAPPPAPPAQPAPDTAPTARRSGVAVQVAAVNYQTTADRLVQELTAAGFKPYQVKEGGLIKVRVGPYPDRPQATAAAEQIRRKFRSSPFLVVEP